MVAGDPAGPSRAAIPAVASASLSIRTVPGQTCAEVAEQLRRWVKETVSERVAHKLSVSPESGQDAYRTPDDLPAVAHLAAAMEEGFGAPVSIDVLTAGAATLALFRARLADG
ncbi:peptidase dimerization domain-containing protein [Nucisporomicrobium flavum]|uniref:peptidase dimerization domain-containing protein n=1 Tax=Nucisporomicrobium flavum TaxID=2785915 RepID=UPI001F2D0B07|nr:peptidase dimerization domain-containing protein [Nucisporomicrobium flavum]